MCRSRARGRQQGSSSGLQLLFLTGHGQGGTEEGAASQGPGDSSITEVKAKKRCRKGRNWDTAPARAQQEPHKETPAVLSPGAAGAEGQGWSKASALP